MVMDRQGTAGQLVITGSIVLAVIALIGGVYTVGQNSAEVKGQVHALEVQMHTALRNGQATLERVQTQIDIKLDRNCRILTQLDQDIRIHGLAATNDFPPFPEVSC